MIHHKKLLHLYDQNSDNYTFSCSAPQKTEILRGNSKEIRCSFFIPVPSKDRINLNHKVGDRRNVLLFKAIHFTDTEIDYNNFYLTSQSTNGFKLDLHNNRQVKMQLLNGQCSQIYEEPLSLEAKHSNGIEHSVIFHANGGKFTHPYSTLTGIRSNLEHNF